MNKELLQKLKELSMETKKRNGLSIKTLNPDKFAELIINECIKSIEEFPEYIDWDEWVDHWCEGYSRANIEAILSIKYKFNID